MFPPLEVGISNRSNMTETNKNNDLYYTFVCLYETFFHLDKHGSPQAEHLPQRMFGDGRVLL